MLAAARNWTILVAVISAASAVQAESEVDRRCPRNLPSTTLLSINNETCYQFVYEEKYWEEAKAFCLKYGGRLVKIDSPSVNAFILRTLAELYWRNNGIWIGLNDKRVEQIWEWTGYPGEANERAKWTNWAPSHPGPFLHGSKDCVKMTRNREMWTWEESLCSGLGITYRFICQYKAKKISTTTSVVAERTTLGVPTEPQGTTNLENTSEPPLLISLEEDHAAPRNAEIRSDAEQAKTSAVPVWLIIIIAACIGAFLFIAVPVCLVARHRRHLAAGKQVGLHFSGLDRGALVGTAYPPALSNPAYTSRPACPLPTDQKIPEVCSPVGYYSLAREPQPIPRVDPNIYLNSTTLGAAYFPMNQSTNSLDKLPPPPPNPVSQITYAMPARRLDSTYIASDRSDVYLCPSDVSSGAGNDVIGIYDVMGADGGDIGEYISTGVDEKIQQMTYDQPKACNIYAEIPEATYNNIHEPLLK